MVSLVDIVPQTRVVTINGGGELVLRGLGLRQIAGLLLRFPSLRNLFAEGVIDLDALLLAAPDAVGAIIAEAACQPEAGDTIADTLPIDDALECLIAVRDLTMPNGASPFFDRLAKLLAADDGRAGKASATSLPRPPNGSSPAVTIPAP